MSAAAFAALEDRLNRSAIARVQNAVANFGAADVGVIFDDATMQAQVGGMGMASPAPIIQLPSESVPFAVVGTAVTVTDRGVARNYVVMTDEPDGSGWSRLSLEVTA